MSKPDDKMRRTRPYRDDESNRDDDRSKTRDKRKSRERKRDVSYTE